MPSGYTAKLHVGDQSFEEFAMGCARAFGALIEMKEDPLDAEIPEKFEPSGYSEGVLATSRTELERIKGLSDEQCEAEAKREFEEEHKRWRKDREEAIARRDRYLAIREKVMEWEPPSAEHEGLKKFMLDQIEQSIRPDCQYAIEREEPTLKSGEQWRQTWVEHYEGRIVYYEKDIKEERERAEGRTEWVQQLRESLGVMV